MKRLPDTDLGRARLVATVIALIGLLGQVINISGATGSPAWDNAARVALVLLGAVIVSTYVRGRHLLLEPIYTPVFCVVAGSAMADEVSVIGLAVAMLLVQSLYGSRRSWAVRSAGGLVAVPVALALSPSSGPAITFDAIGALLVLPQVTLGALIARMIYNALQNQHFVTARDTALARAGARLLAAAELDEVYRIAGEAGAELTALSPGTAMIICGPRDGGILVYAAVGEIEDLDGRVLPRALLTDPGSVVPGFADWHVEELDPARFRLLGARRKVSPSVVDAFRTLHSQIQLGETSARSRAELERRAHHDALTQLPNRAKFFTELAAAVDAGPVGAVALLNIDLDDFKQVNDSFGHAAGDELLIQVSERLLAAAGDRGVAARFGGDEFALLLTGVTGAAEAQEVAARLCAELSKPLRLATATVTVGASIGIAVTEPGVNASALTRRADIAMYSAKARGKHRAETFVSTEHGDVARHRTLEDQLPYAIERGEMVIAVQPYADLRTGDWTGVEALIQWQHPALGHINCRELLDIAERIGAVHDITRHLLGAVCAALDELPRLPVGININARQLLDPRFGDAVLEGLAEGGMPPGRLVLEVIESEQVDDPAAREQLRRLAAAGVKIALDDFGTGHVSLAALRAFPIHQIKTAASFVDGDAGALELVLSLAELVDAETVVQGVTLPQQAERLRTTRAAAVQGPWVGPPVPVGEIAAVIAA